MKSDLQYKITIFVHLITTKLKQKYCGLDLIQTYELYNFGASYKLIMAKKTFNTAELKTIHNFAASFKSKRGKLGVSRQYIEALIKRGKNTDFVLVKIDGIKFICPKKDKDIVDEKFIESAERTRRGKIIRSYETEEVTLEEPFIIDQSKYDKEDKEVKKAKKNKEEDLAPNQLSLF